MRNRLMLPLLVAAGLSLPFSAAAAPAIDYGTAETATGTTRGAAPGIVGNDMNTQERAAPAQGGIVSRTDPDDAEIVQYYGSDMNDVEDAGMVSFPFILAAVLLFGALALVYVLIKRRGGFADHFGR